MRRSCLTSTHRPIVLVPKIDSEVTELVAPGLGNIGMFLPYTEMQHILFHELQDDALVMTSANIPGEPMVLRDEDALALGAECYLFHDREIVNRCDDSVVRSFENGTFYIRKSRGHIPVAVDFPFAGNAIGLGAQESIAGALATGKKLYATQYIGDASSAGVLEFLESAMAYQRRLLGADSIDAIGIDLHPGYSTRRLGKRLAEGSGIKAGGGAASLGACRRSDGRPSDRRGGGAHAGRHRIRGRRERLGGEVLHSTFRFLPAGWAICRRYRCSGARRRSTTSNAWCSRSEKSLGQEGGYFTDVDAALLRKMMTKSPRTTSMGRVMDALSCYLGICQYRSYDGEPAMKLERWLAGCEWPIARTRRSSKSCFPLALSLRGQPVLSVSCAWFRNLYWLAGRSYGILSLDFPVTYVGKEETIHGSFCPIIWEGRPDAIMTGREELGFPKMFAEFTDIAWDQKRYRELHRELA